MARGAGGGRVNRRQFLQGLSAIGVLTVLKVCFLPAKKQRVVCGVGRGSFLILDNLGIDMNRAIKKATMAQITEAAGC